MGTRGAFGFFINGDTKATYNHYDSYPSVLGEEVVTFVQKTSIAKMRNIAEMLVLVDQRTPPTEEQIKECEPWTDMTVSEKNTQDWYCLLRKAQGNLLAYKNGLKYMLNSNDFLGDSLFCEYAYIINIDSRTLEFYRGFNKKDNAKGRYALSEDVKHMREEYLQNNNSFEYYGVELIKEYSFDCVKSHSLKEIVDDMEQAANPKEQNE